MLFLFISLLAFAVFPSEALSVVSAGHFPVGGQADTAAVYDGADHVWILGGYAANSSRNEIYRYNVHTNGIETIGQFPHTTFFDGTAHIDSNGDIYYIGGQWYDYFMEFNASRSVWKVSETSPSPTLVGSLPDTIKSGCTYFNGQNEYYTVGGISLGNGYEPNFFSYNSLENSTRTVLSEVPVLRAVMACAQSEDYLYVFGGYNSNLDPQELNTILKVNPASGGVEELSVTLPLMTNSGSAVVVDDDIYVIGGGNSFIDGYNAITKFNILTGEIMTLNPPGWKIGLTRASSVYIPSLHRIYVFGGVSPFGKWDSEIFFVQLD